MKYDELKKIIKEKGDYQAIIQKTFRDLWVAKLVDG